MTKAPDTPGLSKWHPKVGPLNILVIDDGSDDDEIDLTSSDNNGNGSNHGGDGW